MFRKKKKLRFYKKQVPDGPKYQNPYFPKKKPSALSKIAKRPGIIVYPVFIILLGYFIFFFQLFEIKSIEITGNREISRETVESAVQDELNQKRFWFFPQKNYFMAKEGKIEQCLTENFALKSVKVGKDLPNKLTVEIEERIPNVTYATQEKYFYLSLDGMVTHHIEKEQLNESFPKIIDKNQNLVKVGERGLPENVVSLVIELTEKIIKQTDLEVEFFSVPQISCPTEEVEQEITIPVNTNQNKNSNSNTNTNLNKNTNSANKNTNQNKNSNQTYITTTAMVEKETDCNKLDFITYIEIKSKDGFEVYFPANDETDQQIIKLSLILSEIEDKSALHYIDLRFGEKVYYQ